MILAGSRTSPLRHFWASGILAAVLCIAYFALKYAMVVRGVAAEFYPVLFVLVGTVSYLAIGVLSDPVIIQPLRRVPWLAWGVDLVAGVQRVARSSMRTVPSTLSQAGVRFCQTLFDWQEKTVGLLDESRVFDALRDLVSS